MEPYTYYTISHRDTHKPLGFGGPLDRSKAVSTLLTRRNLALSEWCVTTWHGRGTDYDDIEAQVAADEFVDAYKHERAQRNSSH